MREKLLESFQHFFGGKNGKFQSVLNEIIDEILLNIDVDPKNLLFAVNSLSPYQSDDLYSNYLKSTSFEVGNSKNPNKIFLKGFSADGCPFIYLYLNDNRIPFFKIKTKIDNNKVKFIVEMSDNENLMTSKKFMVDLDEPFFQIKNTYNVHDFGYNSNKKTRIKTREYSDESQLVDFESLTSRQVELYKLINNVIFSKYSNSKFTKENHSVLFDLFYNLADNFLDYQSEFKLDDLVKLTNSVVTSSYTINADVFNKKFKLEEIIPTLVNFVPRADKAPCTFVMDVLDNNKNIKSVVVTRSEGFLSLSLNDKNNNPLCKYMFGITIDGFSLYRRVMDEKYAKDNVSSYIFRMSEKDMNFISVCDSKGKNDTPPVNIIATFNNDSSLDYYSECSLNNIKTYELDKSVEALSN